MKLLLVEDDQAFAQSVKQLLETHYYSVDLADDGQMAQEMTEVFSYDLILLDWVLPKKTGVQVCQDLRASGDRTPIILMTAKEGSSNEVTGLDAGADDYLIKPFGFEELLARIRAVLRRSEGIASPILEWGDLRLNPSSAEVSCRHPDGEHVPIALTPKEYGLLEVFLRNPNRIFSMDALIDKVWAFDDAPTTGAIRTHIKGLRQKMRTVGLAEVIDTVYGLGYRLSPAIAVVVPKTTGPKTASPKTTHSKTARPKTAISANKATQSAKSNPANPSPTAAKIILNPKTQTANTKPLVDLSALWQPVKATYIQRVETLSQTLHNMPTGVLAQSDREDIRTEAHALAGSLGSFGFSEATPQCRHIERLFREHETLGTQQLKELRVAIAKVKETLDTTELSSSAGTSPSAASTTNQAPTESASPIGTASSYTAHSTIANPTTANPTTAKLLIVDDDPELLQLLESLLQDWGFQLQLLSDPQQFWHTLEQFEPDMVLLDVEMPHVSGFELCQKLRDEPHWAELPILFLSAHTEAETIQKVFAIGADDYIRKPIVAAELVARVISRLERARNRKLRAEVDSLTGVDNRQKSMQEMTRLLGLAERYEQPFCLAVIDIDQFKRVNSQFGHAVGDRILRHFGACLRAAFRKEDVIGRWGGEEFVIGFYGADKADGNQCIDSFAARWEQMCIDSEDITVAITFKAGLAVYPQEADDLKTLHHRADEALQSAKQKSVNQIAQLNKSPKQIA